MQPITLNLDNSKILRSSWRFQKDNRAIKCGCNSNNFMLNIRNYSKFIFVSIIHSGIMAINKASIKIIRKGSIKGVLGIIGLLIIAIISLFLGSNHSIFKILNISIGSIILKAISKNNKVFRLVNSIVIIFNQRSNLISTFKSSKLFNLYNIKVIINTFGIRT